MTITAKEQQEFNEQCDRLASWEKKRDAEREQSLATLKTANRLLKSELQLEVDEEGNVIPMNR